MIDLHPIDDHLAWRNRRILAERLGWPDGALEACERADRDRPRVPHHEGTRPAWVTYWSAGPVGEDLRAGFYTFRERAEDRSFGMFDSLPVSER